MFQSAFRHLAAPALLALTAQADTEYAASFTEYGSTDTWGSGNCNVDTTACGFYTSPGYSVAISQNAFGVGPGAGAGPGCGECWKLTAATDSSGSALSNAGTSIVVKVTNLCPASGNPLCSQTDLSGDSTNQYGAVINFDLCIDSGASSALFGSSGVGLAVGNATQVDCSEWSGMDVGSEPSVAASAAAVASSSSTSSVAAYTPATTSSSAEASTTATPVAADTTSSNTATNPTSTISVIATLVTSLPASITSTISSSPVVAPTTLSTSTTLAAVASSPTASPSAGESAPVYGISITTITTSSSSPDSSTTTVSITSTSFSTATLTLTSSTSLSTSFAGTTLASAFSKTFSSPHSLASTTGVTYTSSVNSSNTTAYPSSSSTAPYNVSNVSYGTATAASSAQPPVSPTRLSPTQFTGAGHSLKSTDVFVAGVLAFILSFL